MANCSHFIVNISSRTPWTCCISDKQTRALFFLLSSIVFIASLALNEINEVLCQPGMLTLLVLLCMFHVTCEFCTQVSEFLEQCV